MESPDADLAYWSTTKQAEALRLRRISAVELFDRAIHRIERFDGRINAVVVRDLPEALGFAWVCFALQYHPEVFSNSCESNATVETWPGCPTEPQENNPAHPPPVGRGLFLSTATFSSLLPESPALWSCIYVNPTNLNASTPHPTEHLRNDYCKSLRRS
jgi:hypothetical protein